MSGATIALLGGQGAYSASTNFLSADGVGFAPGTTQTNRAVTVTANGGLPPYTYAWTRVSGDTEIYANNPTSATTRFSVYSATSDTYVTVFKCVVTDFEANPVDSNTVTVQLDVL